MNKSLRFFEVLDELKLSTENSFKEMVLKNYSEYFERTFRRSFNDYGFDKGCGFIEITIKCGPVKYLPVAQKPWYKRIFR